MIRRCQRWFKVADTACLDPTVRAFEVGDGPTLYNGLDGFFLIARELIPFDDRLTLTFGTNDKGGKICVHYDDDHATWVVTRDNSPLFRQYPCALFVRTLDNTLAVCVPAARDDFNFRRGNFNDDYRGDEENFYRIKSACGHLVNVQGPFFFRSFGAGAGAGVFALTILYDVLVGAHVTRAERSEEGVDTWGAVSVIRYGAMGQVSVAISYGTRVDVVNFGRSVAVIRNDFHLAFYPDDVVLRGARNRARAGNIARLHPFIRIASVNVVGRRGQDRVLFFDDARRIYDFFRFFGRFFVDVLS